MITTVTMNASVDKLYLVEQVELGTVMRVKSCNNTAGGKGLNVSRVATLLGEQVLAVGIAGGHAGAYVKEMLQEKGISSDFAESPAETRCCINIRNLSTGEHTEFLEPGAPVNQTVLDAFYQKYKNAVQKSAVVTLSGSMPAGTPADYYAKLVRYAKEQNKKVIVDTSGEALHHSLAAKPTMIKPNIDEMEQLLQMEIHSREELIDAGMRLHKMGIAVVAISMGKDGVLVVSGDGIYHGTTPDIKVINTVGCGDSMVAGFAVGFSRGLPLKQTIRLAVAVSTANALCMETGYYIDSDLNTLFPQVTVQQYV